MQRDIGENHAMAAGHGRTLAGRALECSLKPWSVPYYTSNTSPCWDENRNSGGSVSGITHIAMPTGNRNTSIRHQRKHMFC